MHVEISTRAARELRRIERRQRDRIVDALEDLEEEPPPENLDVRPLTGHSGWLRLRVGDFRAIYRPLTGRDDPPYLRPGVLVVRVVNRRDLERAVRALEVLEDA